MAEINSTNFFQQSERGFAHRPVEELRAVGSPVMGAFGQENYFAFENFYQADAGQAFNISKNNAGGYVLDPHDIGGETYRDISRKFNPTWSGWKKIDALKKSHGGTLPYNFTNKDLDDEASRFYKSIYWDAVMGDRINSQSVANIIFDQTLDGIGRAIQMVQLTLNKHFGSDFPLKSTMTSDVIKKLNSVNPDKFNEDFTELRVKRFQYAGGKLPKSDPTYKFWQKFDARSDAEREKYGAKYLAGWLNRVYKYSGIEFAVDYTKRNPLKVFLAFTAVTVGVLAIVYRNEIGEFIQG